MTTFNTHKTSVTDGRLAKAGHLYLYPEALRRYISTSRTKVMKMAIQEKWERMNLLQISFV